MLRMVVPILPEHIWSKVSGKAATTSYQNKPPIVGDGPFQIVEWQKGKFVRLEANPDYWGGKPKVDEVIFQLYTNPDTMAQDLKLGTIDGAIDVPPAQFKQLGAEPGPHANNATSWQFIEIGMNCYDSPNSLGNPVLLDQQFRQAINWAVDREKVVSVAMNGYATVGSTLIVPYSKYHWEPRGRPAVHLRPGQGQRAARRRRLQGRQRRRLPRDQGRQEAEPALLRHLRLAREPDGRQAHRRLAQGRRHQAASSRCVDAGALIDAQYNYKGDNYAPDWDLFIWYWTQDVDPQFMLSIYTPPADRGLERLPVDRPRVHQAQRRSSRPTIDETARKPIVDQMQQIFYEAAPYAILAYPYQLEAYNTDKWQGWVHVPGDAIGEQQGAVLYSYNNIDTYRFVEPKAATTVDGARRAAAPTRRSSSASSSR